MIDETDRKALLAALIRRVRDDGFDVASYFNGIVAGARDIDRPGETQRVLAAVGVPVPADRGQFTAIRDFFAAEPVGVQSRWLWATGTDLDACADAYGVRPTDLDGRRLPDAEVRERIRMYVMAHPGA